MISCSLNGSGRKDQLAIQFDGPMITKNPVINHFMTFLRPKLSVFRREALFFQKIKGISTDKW
jgi:hypothetical protein